MGTHPGLHSPRTFTRRESASELPLAVMFTVPRPGEGNDRVALNFLLSGFGNIREHYQEFDDLPELEVGGQD